MKKQIIIISILLLMQYVAIAQAQEVSPVLPTLNIRVDAIDKDTFTLGEMDLITDDTVHYDIEVRRRGASSLNYAKPSLAIKMLDANGGKLDVSLFGMRQDNYWILDAMAIDKARARNRASQDLWLEMARKPWYQSQEPECVNGYRGQMVMVTLNEQPMGIYHLCERVDRKQLKLKKYSATKGGIRGVMYKAEEWQSKLPFYSYVRPLPTDTMLTWSGFSVEYPKAEDGEPITWEPLTQYTEFVRTHNFTTIQPDINDYIDMPVYIDYVLLVTMLSARDNCVKNYLLSYYDKTLSNKALITLWDMDHSWGRQYDGSKELTTHKFEERMYQKLMQTTPFRDSIESRYAELRQHIFTVQHMDSVIGKYLDLYEQTGADRIEENLWDGADGLRLNIAGERAYIHNWLVQRIAFLDSIYHYQMPAYPIAGITTTAEYFTEEQKDRCQRLNAADSTITLIYSPKRFDSYPDSLIHRVYAYGTITHWAAPVAEYNMPYLSSDSCFYTTLPFRMLERPGNNGNPELFFRLFYTDEVETDTTFVDPLPMDSGNYSVDPRLSIRDGGMLLMWEDDDIEEMGVRALLEHEYAPVAEWQLDDTTQQAQFGNFRRVPGTRQLYRSFHPFYPIIDDETAIRVNYAALCAERTGIRAAICLSSNQERQEGEVLPCGDSTLTVHIPTYYRQLIQQQHILYAGTESGVGMSYNNTLWFIDRPQYAAWMSEIIRFVNNDNTPLPIQIHCSLGADRTGSLSAFIAALCGADWEDIALDYEATKYTRRYFYRHRGLIRYALREILGQYPDEIPNLQQTVTDFVVNNSTITRDEIAAFVAKLQSDKVLSTEQGVTTTAGIRTRKLLHNGQIVIERNGRIYRIQ